MQEYKNILTEYWVRMLEYYFGVVNFIIDIFGYQKVSVSVKAFYSSYEKVIFFFSQMAFTSL